MSIIKKAARQLVKLKYKQRKVRGIPVISNRRMRQFHQLYAGRDVKQAIFDHERSQLEGIIKGLILLTLFVGILLYIKVSNTYLQEGGYLQRPSLGEGVRSYNLKVIGFPNKASITLDIEEKEYEKEEVETIFSKVYEEVLNTALGKNKSWDYITKALDLFGSTSIDKVKIEWEPEDSEVISPWGDILKEDIPIDGYYTYLNLILSYREYKKIYRIYGRLMMPDISKENQNLADFQNRLLEEMEIQKREDKVHLPNEFKEFQLRYEEPFNKDNLYFILIGAAVIILSYFVKEAKLAERIKKRNLEMLLDYSEIVAKLTILTDCGMTVKGAWKKIINDYALRVEQGDKKKRYAYEEMYLAVYMMENGVYEGKAYGTFAERCRLHPYVKLGRLLEQNIKMGNKHIKMLLENEVEEAFESRKNLAKRLGEEAGTKLLIPMIIMLFLVLIIILVPAFLSFSI